MRVYWADLGPSLGRRPVLVVTRSAAVSVLAAVVVVPITRTIRGIASEVRFEPDQGLGEECVATCDNLMTVPKQRLDREPVGELGLGKVVELDRALRYALEISF